MRRPNGILVLTQEQQTARMIADAVGASEHLESRGICRTLDDLLIMLEREPAACVLVDIESEPEKLLAELDAIISRFPDTRFIVMAREQRSDLLLRAMQSGVRHFLRKDEISGELDKIVSRLMPGPAHRNGSMGSIVTVLSAGGGCGATTIALNLAQELAMQAKDSTLLIDLDLHYGGVAGCLGLMSQYGVADVLADGERIDSHLVRSTAIPSGEHLHVLVSPATVDFDEPKRVQFEHLSRALQKGREAYRYTVVDAPRVALQVATLLAVASVMVYIVLEANVEDIRVARQLYCALAARGIAQERIMPLVNRHRGRREVIRLDEIQHAIACKQIRTVSNDYKAVSAGINYGKPLAVQSPRSALRQDVIKLAEAVRNSATARSNPSGART